MVERRGERAGRIVDVQSGPDGYSAFVPAPLPPDPPLQVEGRLQSLLDEANQALGRLDGVTLLLPDPGQFLYSYVRKEAVLSSQIEGTQSSLSDLLLFENQEAPGVPLDDVEETSNYIARHESRHPADPSGELPLSNRLLREVHEILMPGVRAWRTRLPASSGARRTGSAAPGRGTRASCRRLRRGRARDERPREVPSRRPRPTPILVKAASRTSSSRRSIPSSTATAASAGC